MLKQLFIVGGVVFLLQCSAVTIGPKDTSTDILSKKVETWTLEECNSVVKSYTLFNKKGYQEKVAVRSYKVVDVYIRATPYNKNVICAMTRKEAIQRRLPIAEFRKRLKKELESYTNYTLNPDTGDILSRQEIGGKLLNEYSFMVYFENISMPHRNVEVYRADEGFFLENEAGEFSRVIEISGYYVDDFFILDSPLNTIITFSSLTDDGKNLFPEKTELQNHRLVFNGLQTKPIVIEWKE